jgi:uncharacterized protein YciI
MATWIYVLKPVRLGMLTDSTAEEDGIVTEHFLRLKKLAEEGVALFVGRTTEEDERSFGIVVLEAPDEAAARALMEADPAVERGIMTANLHPFRVALSGGAYRASPAAGRDAPA